MLSINRSKNTNNIFKIQTLRVSSVISKVSPFSISASKVRKEGKKLTSEVIGESMNPSLYAFYFTHINLKVL